MPVIKYYVFNFEKNPLKFSKFAPKFGNIFLAKKYIPITRDEITLQKIFPASNFQFLKAPQLLKITINLATKRRNYLKRTKIFS
jgi:hypothetical protein